MGLRSPARHLRSRSPHPHPVEAADRRDPLLGQAVRGAIGGDPLALGDLEDPEQRVVDLARLLRATARAATGGARRTR